MHFSKPIVTLALTSGAVAAPVPGFFSSIFGSIANTVSNIENGIATTVSGVVAAESNALASLLSSIGITLQTNANTTAGPTISYNGQNPFTFPTTAPSNVSISHTINWPFVSGGNFIDWKTYKANGANLGGWLEKEQTHDPLWWAQVDGNGGAIDEWTLCQQLGSKCGPIFEARYASFLNTSTIDALASVGVNTLRIPTTYAAWINVPGSALYHGNQQAYLRTITNYAISKYNMHCIIGLHSLPGGVNSLDIGEAFGHDGWFFNSTNLNYSFQAIDQVLNFIKTSGHTNGFTIAPINEASDTNLVGFGTDAGLTTNGTNWINTYMDGVIKKTAAVDSRIPVMIQDCFKGASYWSPFYDSSANIVFDSHVYYFAAAGTYSEFVNPAVCGQASYLAQETKFPVFVGEWSLQTMYNNTLAGRKQIFDTQRYAWQKYVAGGAFWTAVSYAQTPVDGQGIQQDYWSYLELIQQGVATKQTTDSYC